MAGRYLPGMPQVLGSVPRPKKTGVGGKGRKRQSKEGKEAFHVSPNLENIQIKMKCTFRCIYTLFCILDNQDTQAIEKLRQRKNS